MPIGKGVLLMPSPVPNLPPNTVALTVRDLPHPATPCLFACRQSANPDVNEFLTGFAAFIRAESQQDAPGRKDLRRDNRASVYVRVLKDAHLQQGSAGALLFLVGPFDPVPSSPFQSEAQTRMDSPPRNPPGAALSGTRCRYAKTATIHPEKCGQQVAIDTG